MEAVDAAMEDLDAFWDSGGTGGEHDVGGVRPYHGGWGDIPRGLAGIRQPGFGPGLGEDLRFTEWIGRIILAE